MITLDPITRSEYENEISGADRAAAIVAALVSPVSVRVYNETQQLVGEGLMRDPWATANDNIISLGELESFSVLVSGTPNPASWVVRIESGDRSISGSFSFLASGGDFQWSLPSWTAGQRGSIGITQIVALSGTEDPVDPEPVVLAWSSVPTVTFQYGVPDTYALRPFVLNLQPTDIAAFSLTNGTLPSGVSLDATTGDLVYDGTGSVNSAQVAVRTELTEITSLNVSTEAPGEVAWTVGQVFKEEDLVTSLAGQVGTAKVQLHPTTFWPNGGIKHAVVSGISLSGSVPLQRGLPLTTPNVSPITSADVGDSFVSLGTFGTVYLSDAINGPFLDVDQNFDGTPGVAPNISGKMRDWIVGPVMRESHYYSKAPNDSHLCVLWYVRKYSSGWVEIEVSVENGWLNVPSPMTKSYTTTVQINGTPRAFHSGLSTLSLTQQHHTRWSRVDWVNPSTPVVDVTHDVAYMRSTKVVPNYAYPVEPTEVAFTTTVYSSGGRTIGGVSRNEARAPTPFQLGLYRSSQAAAGESAHDQIGILPAWDAVYVRTGDKRALWASEMCARSAGRFKHCYRDEASLSWPRLDGVTVIRKDPSSNGTTPPPLGTNVDIEYEHQPQIGFGAWLFLGRHSFLDHTLNLVVFNSLQTPLSQPWPWTTSIGRNGDECIVRIGTTRQIAWQIRAIAAAACAAPDSSIVAADMRRVWAANVNWLWTFQQGPCPGGGTMQNNLGILYSIGTSDWDGLRIDDFLPYLKPLASGLVNTSVFAPTTTEFEFTGIPNNPEFIGKTLVFSSVPARYERGVITDIYTVGAYTHIVINSPIKDTKLPAAGAQAFIISPVEYSRVGPWQHGFLTSSIGWAWDLEISSGDARTKHQFIRDFGYKFSVSHMGLLANGEYSWRRCDTHYEPIGYPSNTSVGQWKAPASFFASARAAYDFGLIVFNTEEIDDSSPLTQKMVDDPDGTGGWGRSTKLWGTSAESSAASEQSTRNHWATLAYAADHGYPGALEGYIRLTTSASYMSANAREILSNCPRYIIVPRELS